LAFPVRYPLSVVINVFHRSNESSETIALGFKEQKQLAVLTMTSDSQIASSKSHVANLPLTAVMVEAVISIPAILITKLGTTVATEEQYDWISGRCTYAALALSTQCIMEIRTTVGRARY